MAVYLLNEEIVFPHPKNGEDNGLLAIGGDLSMERLDLAYNYGIFPWYMPGEDIMWWCPLERFVIEPENIHISKSMKRIIKRNEFEVTFDKDFIGVIDNCKKLREKSEEGTWITEDMKNAYINLFNIGIASSVEVYRGEELVGGLYGVKKGKVFYGESMFSKVSNASKMALIMLAERLKEEGYKYIDCQFHTEHLESMGGQYIKWDELVEAAMLSY